MKTKTFIKKVESNLFTVKESHDGTIIFIHPSRSDFNILAWVNEYENESHIYSVLPKDLAESLLAYTMTPIEEREGKKKYVYRMNRAVAGQEYLKASKRGVVRFEGARDFSTNEPYFQSKFTDAEVENYPEDVRELFKICEKIEVTP